MAKLWDLVVYYKPYWPVTIGTIIATTVLESLDLIVPYATGQILNLLAGGSLDRVGQWLVGSMAALTGGDVGQPLAFGVLLGLVFLVTVVKAPIYPWLGHWLHWHISFQARRDHSGTAHAKILTLPLEYYDEHNAGRIAALVARGLSNHSWTFPQIVGQFIPKVIRLIAICGVILLAEWRIGMVFLLSLLVITAITVRKLKVLSARQTWLEEYTENTQGRTSEIITNIKTVKAFATEADELRRQWERLDREFRVLDYRVHKGYVELNSLRTTIVQICTFLILTFALTAALRDQISLGYFIMVLTLSGMAYSEIGPIGQMAELFARRHAAMDRLHDFLNTPAGSDAANLTEIYPLVSKAPTHRSAGNGSRSSHRSQTSNGSSTHSRSGSSLAFSGSSRASDRSLGSSRGSSISIPSEDMGLTEISPPQPPYHFQGKLDFQHVTFGYDPDRPVLTDFDLVIQPRQTVALVGRSGSGKSTLVKLLFRYFDLNRGQILIDDHDIHSLDITGYRQRLAIVHQEVDVFNGTLLDNLTYGTPKASFDQVEEACRIARVDAFLEQLPNGYYTVVGERGVRLSGGQRQRLGIARALIRDPDVLIFDEATSSLDYESERAIQLAMHGILGTRTTLIIAHRLSTVRDADLIVVLDQGRILEVGRHADLLSQPGLYSRLHTLQEYGEIRA